MIEHFFLYQSFFLKMRFIFSFMLLLGGINAFVSGTSMEEIDDDAVLLQEMGNNQDNRPSDQPLSFDDLLLSLETIRYDPCPSWTDRKREEEIRPFSCHYCDRRFKRNMHMVRHIESRHAPKYSFICMLCRRNASRRDNLQQHIRAVHMKKLKEAPHLTIDDFIETRST